VRRGERLLEREPAAERRHDVRERQGFRQRDEKFLW